MPAGREIHATGWEESRIRPSSRERDAERVAKGDSVGGETDPDGHVADSVFEDEVPADDPGDEFAHGGVRVGIRAAGDGNHRGEFGVTERSECADDGDEDK